MAEKGQKHRARICGLEQAIIWASASEELNPRIFIMNIDKELDTRGLNCPLPILKAKKALAELSSGQMLKVVATDPGSVRDFQAFAKQTGNELVDQQTMGADFIHVMRRR
jgi:TusA-related sulfurtransferase